MKLLLSRTKIRKIDAKFPVGYWFIGLLGYFGGEEKEEEGEEAEEEEELN